MTRFVQMQYGTSFMTRLWFTEILTANIKSYKLG